jgi:hypothetical protein
VAVSRRFTSNPVVIDMNGDRRPDIVAGSNGKIVVIRGLGDSRLSGSRVVATAPGTVRRLLVADLDGDGHPDAIANGRVLFRGQAGGDLGAGVADPLGLGFVRTDMNRDGRPDVVGWSGVPQGARVTLRINTTGSRARPGTLLGRFSADTDCPFGVGDPLQCNNPMRIPFLAGAGPATLRWDTVACVPADLLLTLDGRVLGHTASTLAPAVTFRLGKLAAGRHVVTADLHAQPTGGTCSGGPLVVGGANIEILGTGRSFRR